MIKGLVSVIIPTYGGPEFLDRCIDSVNTSVNFTENLNVKQ